MDKTGVKMICTTNLYGHITNLYGHSTNMYGQIVICTDRMSISEQCGNAILDALTLQRLCRPVTIRVRL